jgi:hypothetical protein
MTQTQQSTMHSIQNHMLTSFFTLFVVSVMFDLLGFNYVHRTDPRLQPQAPIEVCTSQAAMQWWTNTDNLVDARKKLCYNALKPKGKLNP